MTIRLTHQSMLTRTLARLTASGSAYGAAQERLSTGKQFTRPSEDPTGMTQALELRAALRAHEQHSANADDALLWLDLADSKLQSVVERLQRARELAVRADTLSSSQERTAISAEIAEIRKDILGLANSTHQGRSLFAGFASGEAVADVAGVWTYQGDAGQVNRRIGESETVTVNVTADVVFGVGSGSDVFTVLDDFEAALAAGDSAAINASIAAIDGALEGVLGGLATIGAAGTRVEAAQIRHAEEIEALRSQLSLVEDVDIAEAVMELQMQETSYQAVLAAFSRASQPSLVDFLR